MQFKLSRLIVFALMLIVVALPLTQAATLIGKWDFEGDPASTAAQNKVPGVIWDIASVGAPAHIENGRLVCPMTYGVNPTNGTEEWYTGEVHASLNTTLTGYMEKTEVVWFILDKSGNLTDYAFFFRMAVGSTEGIPADGIDYYPKYSAFDVRIRNQYNISTIAQPYGSGGYGPTLETGKLVKLAMTIKDNHDGSIPEGTDTFAITFYMDKFDGNGLQQYGASRNVSSDYINTYGGIGDAVQFLPGVGYATEDSFGATFEEAQVYDGVLTQQELADLKYTGEPSLIGKWTFDSNGGTEPNANKAPGVNWSNLSFIGTGASIADGKLTLSRYESGGSWLQSSANAMLQTDLGPDNYFTEMTQIAWVKWPGFDTAADWARLTSATKFSSSTYDLLNAKAAQGIAMKATDDTNWTGYRSWEYLDGSNLLTSNQWAVNGGVDPPTDRYIKLAQVLKKNVSDANYQCFMYWDIGDGNGLVQVGSPAVVWANQINAFGQSGTDCLVDGTGGPRYDGFGIMDHSWNVPQSAGEIEFEEVRFYAGAMRTSDIADASFEPIPAPRMVGQWSFDEYGGVGPLSNKAPGVKWNNLTVTGSGANIVDGKLVLPRYQNAGVWYQSSATTMLAADLGTGNYFKDMTQIAWVKWPGFDTTGDWSRLTCLAKFPSSTYTLTNVKAAQNIAMKATDNTNWTSNRVYEYLDSGSLISSTQWANVGGIDPPTDRYIKIAQVLQWKDSLRSELTMYWDTGSGLVQIGTPQLVWNSQISTFGQCNTESLVPGAPTGNLRYDGFGIMDYCWNVPQSAGQISFDEVRLYAGALSQSDIAALTPISPTKKLIGQWTFDNYLGTDPLANKAPDASWAPLTLTGTGAGAVDGKLVLPRYLSGTWKQSSATSMLTADLGPSGYAREITHVLWLKWPGFSTTADWARMTTIMKFSTNAFINGNWRAGQSLVMKATDNVNWTGHRTYEYLDTNGVLQKTTQWANIGGVDPLTDRYIKVAEVLRLKDLTQYEQVMYWDLNDGNGLVQVGTPAVVWPSWVNAFGQCGTDCLISASGGKRWDGYGLMDYCWSVPQSAGEIDFEETRLYDGALTQTEITNLRYVGEPEPVKPIIGTSQKSLRDAIMTDAAASYDWVLWGKVTVIDGDSFTIDDGSGVNVKVIATGHGLGNTNYVSVRGSLDVTTNTPTLTAKDMNVIQ
ncbi:MAG: hypothetical protein ACYC64_04425 [Armatimonadota bacterium]